MFRHIFNFNNLLPVPGYTNWPRSVRLYSTRRGSDSRVQGGTVQVRQLGILIFNDLLNQEQNIQKQI